MKIKKLILSLKTQKRIEGIKYYLLKEGTSREFANTYLKEMRDFLKTTLLNFPESGRDVSDDFGEGVRKIVYQGYSILYKINYEESRVEIVNIYRENLP